MESHQLDRLIEAIQASPKYKSVSSDLVRYIGTQELAKGHNHNLKGAIKATKNKLHQVGGAYQDSAPRYRAWLDKLKQASQPENRKELLAVCKWIMQYHSSTRERLPMLEQFYSTILAGLPPINSVIDVSLGLHPLAIPWMPLAGPAPYYAYDMYQDMTDFLNEWLSLLHVQGYAQACNVIHYFPTQRVYLAFMLKAIPCLEQVDRSADCGSWRPSKPVILSSRSLPPGSAGKKKGMVPNFRARFFKFVE